MSPKIAYAGKPAAQQRCSCGRCCLLSIRPLQHWHANNHSINQGPPYTRLHCSALLLKKAPKSHPHVRSMNAVILISRVLGSQDGWSAPEECAQLAVAEKSQLTSCQTPPGLCTACFPRPERNACQKNLCRNTAGRPAPLLDIPFEVNPRGQSLKWGFQLSAGPHRMQDNRRNIAGNCKSIFCCLV